MRRQRGHACVIMPGVASDESGRRTHLGVDDLRGVVRAVDGTRELVSVERLRGGTRKGVYRLGLAGGTSRIAYVWHPDEDFWPDAPGDHDGPFRHAAGLELFESAHDQRSVSGCPGCSCASPADRSVTSPWSRTFAAARWRS